jgi:DNA mismatch repair protein MutS
MAVVTGPNMSGKSTYMRQVALICVLTQLGSFVPARTAEVPIIDRVFTRVGASDDIAGGRSTFMVEMTELADILTEADADSLVVLDEVGRGTSTRDGYAIAQAATEYLHDEIGSYTLFATHHHELTDVAAALSRASNYHFSAARTADGIEFEHDLRGGPAEASYGVEVAEMAGVPGDVVDRAGGLLEGNRETDAVSAIGDDVRPAASDERTGPSGFEPDRVGPETTTTDGGREAILAELESVDLAETTPLEALNLLSELQSSIE